MIEVVFYKDGSKHYRGFKAKGHANYSEYNKDIVCSAVSMLTQTMLLGIVQVLNVNATFKIKQGFAECIIPELHDDQLKQKIDVLIRTMYAGLKNIQPQYPKYLTLYEKEV